MDILSYTQLKILQVAARLYVIACNMIQDIGEICLSIFLSSFIMIVDQFFKDMCFLRVEILRTYLVLPFLSTYFGPKTLIQNR